MVDLQNNLLCSTVNCFIGDKFLSMPRIYSPCIANFKKMYPVLYRNKNICTFWKGPREKQKHQNGNMQISLSCV